MNMTGNQIAVLCAIASLGGGLSQRAIAEETRLSLGTVNAAVRVLEETGLLTDRSELTEAGDAAVEPFRVENAVIMAAGLSSRFAPISYERPKGVLRVRGEVLIERQIRQLREAGVEDITVVVGYKKEEFFYLEDLFGVRICVNDSYASRNNNSTLKLVEKRLGNTYICSSDDYFTENPFRSFVPRAYYASEYVEGETDEYCIVTQGKDRLIAGATVGGRDAWIMLGHVYFDRSFSSAFVEILDAEYDRPETAGKLWEDIYLDHVSELPMVCLPYNSGVIFEFDSLDELRAFDPAFVDNVDSSIMDNICAVLGCTRRDIYEITPIKQGLTNLSFSFVVGGQTYVYRHPGAGTEEIINRKSEAFSQSVASRLGIDGTFVFEDPEEGWKISRFVPGCVEFDYHDDAHVKEGLRLARVLHESGETSEWSFDVYAKSCEIVELLEVRSGVSFPDFAELSERAARLADCVRADGIEPCLCHNDFYSPNFLVHERGMDLIDWEYSAMSDYASDLGTFICCSDYDVDDARRVIALYFERTPTFEEERHCLAYVALCAWYWFVWALYKDASGDPVGEWLYLWYRATKRFGVLASGMYGG